MISHTNCAIDELLYNILVQPLIKRESVWMDHKTLFPVLEMGFCIFDILKKPAICSGSIYWQAIQHREPDELGANLEHIINFTEVKRISIYQQPADIWFLPRMVIFEFGYYYILKSKAI